MTRRVAVAMTPEHSNVVAIRLACDIHAAQLRTEADGMDRRFWLQNGSVVGGRPCDFCNA